MKKLPVFLCVVLMASSVTVAFAASPTGKAKGTPATGSMSFEDIRAACLDPSRFHNQVPPTNIQVSCRDVQAKWVPENDGTLAIGNQRQVTASVVSDKYTARAVSGSLKAADQVIACPRLKQVTETVESIRAVTCPELVEFTGNVIDFCAGTINSLREANPRAVNVEATGQLVNLCGAANTEPFQK